MLRMRALELLLLLLVLLGGARAEYSEKLTLRSVPGERKVAAHFHLSVREPFGSPAALFPPALAQILDAYDADALHLSFALGRYSHARFGYEPAASAPFGARLQAELRVGREPNASAADVDADLRRRWRGLTAELGGVFSASLAQMDETVVVELLGADARPEDLGAYPWGPRDGGRAAAEARLLHGALAREELCTENLAPWLKILPCRAAAGLGRLVDPVQFLSGEFLSLSLAASRSPWTREWALHQHLTVVRRADASPSLDDLFLGQGADWELAACPLATASVLIVDGQATDLRQQPVRTGAPLFSSWTQRQEMDKLEDAVEVHRFATGHGQVRGGLAVRLTNRHARPVRVRYHDVAPWFLRVYLSSLRVVSGGGGAPLEPQALAFEPAELRGRPSQWSVQLELPARSSAVLSLQFDKAFVRLSEHPPDANRGFDLAPGVAVFSLLEGGEGGGEGAATTLFTEPLLVPLPTPDFSMPYNVITMTSTVVAFFVGSMLNSLLRKAPRIQQLMARPATV